MFTDIPTILQAITLLLLLLIIIKQRHTQAQTNQTDQRVEEQIKELNKQMQVTEQQLRENLLVHLGHLLRTTVEKLGDARHEQTQQSAELKEQLQHAFANHRARFDERQMETLKILQETLQKGAQDNHTHVKQALSDYARELGLRVDQLTHTTEARLKDINQQVEKRLADGFIKTNETFHDVIKRLAFIDAAQKKITELSSNIVSLQDILNDKRSRGTFGEVQLAALIRNVIPEQHFSLQHVLSNQRRPDCILFLPEPTGHIAIDAKFPLDNFRLLVDADMNEHDRQQATRQFKTNIRKHIQDIAEKYIIPGETADGAMMFIPAEAVFAEIHAHHTDLVDYAHQAKVWIVSPTTMMAILTTARAVLKDAATRQQIHEIQGHLHLLADDFERFQIRMNNLAKRIAQTHHDVEQIHLSSKKITQRFVQIERAELDQNELAKPILPPEATLSPPTE
jgi:DNA recombination protein RmuC